MTIMATHFAIVLGAWRLRVRIDIDEPRHEDDGVPVAASQPQRQSAGREPASHVSARGRG